MPSRRKGKVRYGVERRGGGGREFNSPFSELLL